VSSTVRSSTASLVRAFHPKCGTPYARLCE
jgi:hypothetical protein